jgi:trehalose/maltose hydrolase-like predicted phosphorylase
MVNGLAGLDVGDGLEGFARAPFPLAADVSIDGVRMSRAEERVRFLEQRYDFSTAQLTTVLEYRNGDATARIEALQWCSHVLPTIVLQELRITVDRAADVIVTVGIDPTSVPGHGEYPKSPSGKVTGPQPDGLLTWATHGDISTCGLAYASECLGTSEAQRTTTKSDELGLLATAWSWRARADRPYRVRQMTSLVPHVAHPHPVDHAARLLSLAVDRGWDRMRSEHEAAWAELWRARIVIDGADRRWQAITDASVFISRSRARTRSSVERREPCSRGRAVPSMARRSPLARAHPPRHTRRSMSPSRSPGMSMPRAT